MTKEEASEILTSIKNTPAVKRENGADIAFDLAIKALEWQYKMQYGNCDYCKHKNYASFEYPCTVCGDHEPFQEMWEEIDNAPTVEPDVNCSHCDYFKFSQSFIENVVKLMTDYNIETVDDLMKELNHINELIRIKDELEGKENESNDNI